MKKFLFLLVAATGMLFATSCSTDDVESGLKGNEAQITFSLGLEDGIGTRAISDGTEMNKLFYAVYDANNKLITTIDGSTGGLLTKSPAFATDLKETINLTLAKGQTYTVAFWAQNDACVAYSVDPQDGNFKVSVSYAGENNDEKRDAFFAAMNFKVTGSAVIDVELKRPFAQVNVGVYETDWEAAVNSGIEIKNSKVVIKDAATSLNLLDGSVSGAVDVTYDLAAIPAEVLKVDTDDDDVAEEYVWLSMSYILPNANPGHAKTTLDNIAFTFDPEQGEDIVLNTGLNAVPVQRNWRTNILGKLLTGDLTFNITIDPIYDNDHNIILGEKAVAYTDLAAELAANTSNQPIIYNVQGLASTDDVTIDIPASFGSEELTLNFTDIKDGATLTITGATYAKTLVVKVPATTTISTLTVNTPNAHVYLASGKYTTINATTSSSTLVIGAGVAVDTIKVKEGNVEIQNEATVEKIEKADGNDDPVFVYMEDEVENPELGSGVVAATENENGNDNSVFTINLAEDLTISDPIVITKNTIINGNGNNLLYTGADRVINVATEDVNLEINDLNIECTSGYCQRGINYASNGELKLNKVTIDGPITYAVNLPGTSDDAKGTITDSEFKGCIALNVWGKNVLINATDSKFACNSDREEEGYSAITLNNNGETSAEGTVVNIIGGEIDAACPTYGNNFAVSNCTETGKVNISESTKVTGPIETAVVVIYYDGYNECYTSTDLASGMETAVRTKAAGLRLIQDVTLNKTITIAKDAEIKLNLNGHNISYAVENDGKASAIFVNNGTLEITNSKNTEATISYVASDPDLEAIPAYATNTITNEGTLYIGKNVTVSNGSEGGASYAVDDKGKFTLDGGKLVGNRCALRIAKYNQDDVQFTMESGMVTAATPAWIQLPGSDAKAAPKITVVINDGTFLSTKEPSADNNVLYTYSYGNSHKNVAITINGGQFLGGTVSIGSGYKGDAPQLTINGGIFAYDVLQWLEGDTFKVLKKANK